MGFLYFYENIKFFKRGKGVFQRGKMGFCKGKGLELCFLRFRKGKGLG